MRTITTTKTLSRSVMTAARIVTDAQLRKDLLAAAKVLSELPKTRHDHPPRKRRSIISEDYWRQTNER